MSSLRLVRVEVEKRRNRETEKSRNGEIEKPRNRETEKSRNRETEKPRNGETEKPRNGETEKSRNGETEKSRNGETEKPRNGETEKPRNGETEKSRNRETEKSRNGETEKRRNGETEKPRNRETEKRRNRETEKSRNGETEKRRNRETEKRRNRETEKPRNGEIEKRRNRETEKPRNRETEKPRNGETEKRRNGEIEKRRNRETEKPRNGETEKRRNREIEKSRNGETKKPRNGQGDMSPCWKGATKIKNKILFFLIIFIISSLFSTLLYPESKTEEIYKQSKIFAQTISIIQNSFVHDIKSEDLISSALNGMINKLDDYSQLLDENKYKEVQLETSGFLCGIGIRYEKLKDKVEIIEVYENTPASKAGIMNKDEIYSIDGEILKNGIENEQNKDKILDKIRGKIGTKLEIEIKRLNPKTAQLDILKFKIIREKIKMSTVASELLAGDIAYVKIYEFTFATKDEFDSQYKNLLSKGAKYLILDLRDNPGGVFFGAVDLVKRFIGENKFIVSMKNKDNFESYSADKKAIFDYSPLVVLINKNSASSAEIFAGVIRDYKRGVLVGEKTFGKGSVQTVFDLENGKGLRLTTGKYFLPHGDCIDKNGIDPNFYVAKQDDKDNVLDFAIQLLRNSQILKKIGH